MTRYRTLLGVVLLLSAIPVAAKEAAVDPASGLKIAPGWEKVRGHCTACHSSKLIIQNHHSRERWESLIRWMQETQGLWDLGADEAVVLDYLAAQYGTPAAPPGGMMRRAPLMPQ
ncbi:hypothetical protein GCM10011348_42280 [Marinobacterium nitratireducens]|uniref:Sulfite dehydrogenase (Cytochrome) subunit SorB n=1 Tax=Marinobacterium nitratireducens TaxID=518897 RepID=A0A918DXY3_9GAMM|nr:hypothetical protein [Marinobacterium nitratireducens]GGO87940.1 hypothetical protein GCM10011348_42280 [Marinobacterium nitratireducens]